MHNGAGGYDICRDHGLILLKRVHNFDQVIINNTFTDESVFKVAKETADFVIISALFPVAIKKSPILSTKSRRPSK